ncbi:MAG: hypothetical protein CVU74_07525 [Deltaproteobacteria bacterium HGW-Deltaproteobacteria-9]|nr:MAG: hypothetical protein CVU74_07525 [Deltaproteobacteria bacterium HGW-Deltaproteobacteria-9]
MEVADDVNIRCQIIDKHFLLCGMKYMRTWHECQGNPANCFSLTALSEFHIFFMNKYLINKSDEN